MSQPPAHSQSHGSEGAELEDLQEEVETQTFLSRSALARSKGATSQGVRLHCAPFLQQREVQSPAPQLRGLCLVAQQVPLS